MLREQSCLHSIMLFKKSLGHLTVLLLRRISSFRCSVLVKFCVHIILQFFAWSFSTSGTFYLWLLSLCSDLLKIVSWICHEIFYRFMIPIILAGTSFIQRAMLLHRSVQWFENSYLRTHAFLTLFTKKEVLEHRLKSHFLHGVTFNGFK